MNRLMDVAIGRFQDQIVGISRLKSKVEAVREREIIISYRFCLVETVPTREGGAGDGGDV